jgi:PAS domain S-box-containing protein
VSSAKARRGKPSGRSEPGLIGSADARLRRSQELGGAHPYEWDLATGALIAYPGLGGLFGLSDDEIITYDAITSRIHPDDRLRVRAAHQTAIRRGGLYEQEYRVLLPGGTIRWVLARGEVVLCKDGKAASLAGVVVDITRRKEAEPTLARREVELAESQRRFQVLADAMPQMVWSTRSDGYHDYYNRRWYEFTGMPEGSTDGEEWNGMFHPDDQERAWAKWRLSLATGEPYEIEYRLRHRSGEYRWVLGRALPVRNEQGDIERWFGTCTDIHDLKRAEQALAESEEFTRRLLASSDDCIKVLDADAHLRFMSEGGMRVMEVDDFSKIEGCRWTDFWSGPAGDQARQAVAIAKAGGTGRFEGFCPTVAGTPKWWDVAVTAIEGQGGEPQRLLSISRDITERKRAEQQVAETAERYRLAGQATNDAIWDWDLGSDHIQWNEAVRTLFGYVEDDVGPSGQWWKDNIHPDDRDCVVEGVHAVIEGTGERWSDEYRFRRADGSYATVFDRGYVLRDQQGNALRMIGAMLDITARKQAEHALATERARLRAIIETVPVGIVIAEAPSGRIVEGNPQVERIFRHPVLPSPDITSYKAWVAFHPDGRQVEGPEYPLSRAITKGETSTDEYLYQRGDGRRAWVRITGAPIRDEEGSVTGGVVAIVDIDQEKRREAELRQREALLSSIFQSEGLFTSVMELREGEAVYLMANERAAAFFGLSAADVAGRSLTRLGVASDEAQRWLAFLRETYAKGEPVTIEYPFAAGGHSIHCLGTFTPLPRELSEHPRLSMVTLDISERKRLEEQHALVSREMAHRTKNSLAIVQSVISSTARHASSVAEFRQAVTERITALAKTQTLLIETNYAGASLRDILRTELEPYDDGSGHRVRLEGPEVRLPSEIATAFGMAVHELTTNCAKYGAFSLPGGSVHVKWQNERRAPDLHLALTWEEHDGPLVTPPAREGFGSTLLRRALGRQVGGEVQVRYAPEGLRVRVTALLP